VSESAVAKLLEALRELTPSNEATPVWRELGAEARVRGLARRTFREWCQRMGVAIRDVGGIAYVSPPEVDRVIAQGPVRPTPPSLTPQGETDAQERDEHLQAIHNHRARRAPRCGPSRPQGIGRRGRHRAALSLRRRNASRARGGLLRAQRMRSVVRV
jgi:hypothetical protein